MHTDYTSITELPGNKLTKEQIEMICLRYYTAGKYVEEKDVLEIGCGPGLGLNYLLKKGAKKVTAGDINEKSLNIAREHYKHNDKIELKYLDAHEFPFKNSSFNVILMFEVIFYLQDLNKCMNEIKRVMSDNGIFVLCLPNKDVPSFIKSPFSTKYFSVPELYGFLSNYFKAIDIYGAFPIIDETKLKNRLLKRSIGKFFNILPKSDQIKEFIKERFMGKNIVLGNEIDGDYSENITMDTLPKTVMNNQHQIIYAICKS